MGTIEFDINVSDVPPGHSLLIPFFSRWCVGEDECRETFGVLPPQPIQLEGGWVLELEIDDAGDGDLVGVARADLGDGSVCLYDLDGSHNANKDLARLALHPTTPGCAKTSLRLTEVRMTEGVLSGRLRYQLFGSLGDLIVESSSEAGAR
jgi:hypothetical protein